MSTLQRCTIELHRPSEILNVTYPVHAGAGFLSPASRGALLTALLVMYLLLALSAGFAAVWLWGLIQVCHSLAHMRAVPQIYHSAGSGHVSP